MRYPFSILLSLFLVKGTNSFGFPLAPLPTSRRTRLSMAKGFGKDIPPSSKTAGDVPTSQPELSTVQSPQKPTKNAGQEALDRLRRAEVEKRNEELRSIQDLRSVDQSLSENPNAAVIPERVAQRMGKRMIPFVGVPIFGVMGIFVVFWYLATYKNMEFQPALVAFSTIGTLGAGLLGITYSVMSASWDEDREGSSLGFDEFKKNVGSLKGGLKRTRENAILREKMAGLGDEEIERAIQSLDKREEKQVKKKLGLNEKITREME